MNTDPNDTAFPATEQNNPLYGLSKREYFAVMALQGFCANPAGIPVDNRKEGADLAVKMADILIEALNKEIK